MQTQTTTSIHRASERSENMLDGHACGVSWGAVLAGAVAAAALSYILLILGLGLGLSAFSPWSYDAEMMGKTTFIWLAFTQLAAAGIGGYLAGRLRVKWPSVHTDEVYFRDTAHGLLAWCSATLLMLVVLAGAMRAGLGAAVDVGAATMATATGSNQATPADTVRTQGSSVAAYFTDLLLRSEQPSPELDNGALRTEVGRMVGKIFLGDMVIGALTADDQHYLATLVTRRSGLSQADAEQRVSNVIGRITQVRSNAQAAAKVAADKARKSAAHAALWLFVALLFGAFVASLCATFGGRQRDGALLVGQT